jgi:hypothetical protein
MLVQKSKVCTYNVCATVLHNFYQVIASKQNLIRMYGLHLRSFISPMSNLFLFSITAHRVPLG